MIASSQFQNGDEYREMVIRTATTEDLESLIEASNRAVSEIDSIRDTLRSRHFFRQKLVDLLFEQDEGCVLVCTAAEKVVGFHAARRDDVDRDMGKTAIDLLLWVDEEYRHMGIAMSLWTSLYVELAKKGFDALLGAIDLHNDDGIHSALRADFMPIQALCIHKLETNS